MGWKEQADATTTPDPILSKLEFAPKFLRSDVARKALDNPSQPRCQSSLLCGVDDIVCSAASREDEQVPPHSQRLARVILVAHDVERRDQEVVLIRHNRKLDAEHRANPG
jgi:hypothetical protein